MTIVEVDDKISAADRADYIFLTIKVVLWLAYTITVFRNATDNINSFPRMNDWPTDLGVICNFPFSGGGGCLMSSRYTKTAPKCTAL